MTLGNIVSNTGGYMGSITLIASTILYYYQCFMFETSLIKRLYKEKNDDDSDSDDGKESIEK
jgi:hypothetical protein